MARAIKEILTKKQYIERIKDNVEAGAEFDSIPFTQIIRIAKLDGTVDLAMNISQVNGIQLKEQYIVLFEGIPLGSILGEFQEHYWIIEGEIVEREDPKHVM